MSSNESDYSHIELSRNERKALYYLRIPVTHIPRAYVTVEVIADRLGVPHDSSEYIVKKLIDNGLAEYVFVIHGQTPTDLGLTPKGKEYLQSRFEGILTHIFWSLAVPVVVSVITTLITTYYSKK